MKSVYIGNLPHATTDTEVRDLFEAHGAVEKITLVTDRDTGRSRGFGFVEMTNASEADKAIAALNGPDLGGRALIINEAKPKSEHTRGEVTVLAAEAAVGATTIAAIRGGHANRACSFLSGRHADWKMNKGMPGMIAIAGYKRSVSQRFGEKGQNGRSSIARG